MKAARAVLHVLLLAAAAVVHAQAPSETAIKAAFVYKFGGFVEWPAEAFAGPAGALFIGVAGGGALAEELEKVVAGRTIQGRAVVVRRLRGGEPAGRLHMLFVADEENARLGDLIRSFGDQAVLVISETESSLTRGSAINFVAEGKRVRFDVSPAAAERHHVRISARLLTVARKVLPS